MKHHRPVRTIREPLILKLEHLRIIGGSENPHAPPQTNGSTAESCQTSKFACCKLT
jgi:hypothetical protein